MFVKGTAAKQLSAQFETNLSLRLMTTCQKNVAGVGKTPIIIKQKGNSRNKEFKQTGK